MIVSEDNNNNGKENEEDWMSLPPPLMPLIPNSTAREEDMILRELRYTQSFIFFVYAKNLSSKLRFFKKFFVFFSCTFACGYVISYMSTFF